MASLIGSKLAKISLKAQRRLKQVYLGLFEPKSDTMSAWPIAGLLGCVLYLFLECNWFWPKSGQVYLILAKTLLFFSSCHISCGDARQFFLLLFFPSPLSMPLFLFSFLVFHCFLSFLYFIECVCRACHIHGNCIVYSPYCLPLQWGSLYSAGYLVRAPAIVRVKSLGTT